MKRLVLFLVVMTVFAACELPPPLPRITPPPARFGLAVCNQTLPGSQILADIDAAQVTIVCENQPSPSDSYGWYNKTVIHIWAPPANNPPSFVRKVAAHEYGHYVASKHRDWEASWYSPENFAESWAWCNYPHDVGVGYVFQGPKPTAGQCVQMQQWYAVR